MIASLTELNNAVNGIANTITRTVCTRTKDGSFRLSLDDIDCTQLPNHVSEEDLYAYGDFIAGELAGRKEFESIDYRDHEFTGQCKREYCPNLEDRRLEEPLLPVSQPLSINQLSEIGETAISALQCNGLTSLRDTLGMDYLQVRQLGLAHQQHFFTVETPASEKPFWSEDIESILHYMKKQCELGTQPKLYYNEFSANSEIMRIPLAEECCGKIASVATAAEYRPKDVAYIEAAQKVEGAVYGLPQGYGLSYTIKAPNTMDFTPLNLRDAVTRFAEAAKDTEPLVLTARLNKPGGNTFPEAVLLVQTRGRTIINAHTDPDSPFQPHRGSFYTDLALLVFPDQVLDIDRWRIQVIAPGERYGRGNHLINEGPEALVEFRDMDGASSGSPNGVLVASYPIDALIRDEQGRAGISPGQGLNLYDDVESWTLSAGQLAPILSWLRLNSSSLNIEKNINLEHKLQNARTRSEAQQKEFGSHSGSSRPSEAPTATHLNMIEK